MKTILYNANVITMDSKNPFADTIIYENNKIIFVGSYNNIEQSLKNTAKQIDLNNKTILPGFIDSHLHLINYGYSKKILNLFDVKSLTNLTYIGKNRISDLTAGSWLMGRGWNEQNFEELRVPTKKDLDMISTTIPIIFVRTCGHIACLNSKAIELTQVYNNHDEFKDLVEFDTDDSPTGIVKENALGYVLSYVPSPTINEIKDLIKSAMHELNSFGITSVHSDDFECFSEYNYKDILSIYKQMARNNELTVRVFQQCLLPTEKKLTNFLSEITPNMIHNPFYTIGHIKLLQDGSLGGSTALLSYPYLNDSQSGTKIYSQSQLNNFVALSNSHGFPTMIHGIGDLAIKMILEAYQYSSMTNGIVHMQITDKLIFDSLEKQQCYVLAQPFFINSDMEFIYKKIPAEKIKNTYNWKTIYQLIGDKLSFGSDAPVDSPNVLYGLHAAVSRTNLNNLPPDGFIPNQKLSLMESLKCYTINGAKLSKEEHLKGSLEVGKLADIVILDSNLFEHSKALKDVQIYETIVDGKVVYIKKS